jgi:hypothetical protein
MPRVVVRTPPVLGVRAEAAYLVDTWTRASIDLKNGREQRARQTLHEVSAKLGVEAGGFRAGGSYRYVSLVDYASHTFALPLAYAFTQWGASLTVDPYLRFNQIGRLGDPVFRRSSAMAGARVSFSPWLGSRTLGQLGYELQRASGYLASPYNYVGVGGSGYACVGAALCVPETLPNLRLQHALVLQLRRALTEALSIGLGYRFFVDDWGMTSHTLEPDLALMPWRGGLLRLRYRAYLQSATEAYRAAHAPAQRAAAAPTYLASDPRWATLQTHRVSLDVEHAFHWPADRYGWTALLSVSWNRIGFTDGINETSHALEGTAMLALSL